MALQISAIFNICKGKQVKFLKLQRIKIGYQLVHYNINMNMKLNIYI